MDRLLCTKIKGKVIPMKKMERNSNFELLRIISMLLIVFHHSVVHGLLNNSIDINGSGNAVSSQVWLTAYSGELIAMFGKVAVAIFVMISGYFLVNSSAKGKKTLKKVILLVTEVCFYSLLIYLIALFFNWINPSDLSTKQQAFFPFFYNTYWFATEYLLLYLIYPYINAALHNITRIQHRNLILIGIITFTFIPMIIPNFIDYGSYGEVILFALYYIIGGYLRLYDLKNEKFRGIVLFVCGSIILSLIMFYYNYMGGISNNQQYFAKSFVLAGQYSFIVVFIAMGVMMLFKHINLGQNRIINTIAATTFGIYLIHDNPIIEQIIWMKWLNMPSLLTSNVGHFLLKIIIACPLIFIICSVIDLVRINLFNTVGLILKKLETKVNLKGEN